MHLSRAVYCAALSHLALALFLAGSAWGQGKLKVLHDFGGPGDGYHPYGGLVFDNSGNLYGTAPDGPGTGCGGFGCGIAYALKPNADGSWTEDVIHSFQLTDGSYPLSTLVFDNHGNLYGTTSCYYGYCATGDTVFRLTSTFNGAWSLSTLFTFPLGAGGGGVLPISGVVLGPAGRLYGTTEYGGTYGRGSVYSMGPISPFSWYEVVAHTFTGGADGSEPFNGLTFDGSSNAYGTTYYGGANGVGVVFKLTPNKLSFGWTERVLYSFTGKIGGGNSDGAAPVAGVTFDSAGNLYGTTVSGGPKGFGTVFKLTHNADDSWTESVIHTFTGGSDGEGPYSEVTFDGAGNLYGTTASGGSGDFGTLYKLTPYGGQWTETILHAFSYFDGAEPGSGVIMDKAGNLYGTTGSGGTYGPNGGVAYEFIPQ